MAAAGFCGSGVLVEGAFSKETPMLPSAGTSLLDRFAALKDPRQQAKVLYPLPEILLLLLGATLAGADDLVEIELWGKQQLAFLRRFRPFTRGIRRGRSGIWGR
jgi:DDE_Tnp_1-associated